MICIGVGKLGYVVCKIVVIFVFMGMFVYYVYLIEVSYGDLGMIIGDDVVLVLFKFGEM